MKSPKENKYAWTAKVGAKGQIVIPAEARQLFNINAGDTVLLLGDTQKGIALVQSDAFSQIFDVVSKNKEKK